jgi:hypothetical protein
MWRGDVTWACLHRMVAEGGLLFGANQNKEADNGVA